MSVEAQPVGCVHCHGAAHPTTAHEDAELALREADSAAAAGDVARARIWIERARGLLVAERADREGAACMAALPMIGRAENAMRTERDHHLQQIADLEDEVARLRAELDGDDEEASVPPPAGEETGS